MRETRRGWTMLEADARSMLTLTEERIRSSDIRVEHRDALIQLRAMIDDDPTASSQDRSSSAGAVMVIAASRERAANSEHPTA